MDGDLATIALALLSKRSGDRALQGIIGMQERMDSILELASLK